MDADSLTVKNRRARLRQWFSAHSIPANEKSYISQLLSGTASFGEKAARRLENQYGMGEQYLDAPANTLIALSTETTVKRMTPSEKAMQLALAFDTAHPSVQEALLRALNIAP